MRGEKSNKADFKWLSMNLLQSLMAIQRSSLSPPSCFFSSMQALLFPSVPVKLIMARSGARGGGDEQQSGGGSLTYRMHTQTGTLEVIYSQGC